MSVAIIIPARLESSRMPKKLIQADSGIPLICHTVMAALNMQKNAPDLFASVQVAADHREISGLVADFTEKNKLPVTAVLTSPLHASGSDRIAEAAALLPPEITHILNLQGDEPEMDLSETELMVREFLNSGSAIGTMAYRLAGKAEFNNPSLVKVVLGSDGQALYFSRSPIPFNRDNLGDFSQALGHVGIYIYERKALEKFVSLPPGKLEQLEKLEQLRALENGLGIFVQVMKNRPHKGIDTKEDYQDFVRRQTGKSL